jgi:hypothetical protein
LLLLRTSSLGSFLPFGKGNLLRYLYKSSIETMFICNVYNLP